jgi:co-chaperonin GroES (HSP10)
VKLKLKHDWMLVRIDPAPTQSSGGIHLVGAVPIRTATVLDTGPGRRNRRGVLVPMELKAGDRFPFLKAVTETKQGLALGLLLEEYEALVRENDVLFVMEEDVAVTL